MLEDLDQTTFILSESIARTFSRRKFVVKTVKGAFAALAGLSLGHVGVKDAMAQACSCIWLGGASNANCPTKGGCPGTGACPSGCSNCVQSDGCINGAGVNLCPYASATWISCSGLGSCGFGHRLCRDCKCNTCSGYLCTCLGPCVCCSCCRAADVEAEMRRVAALYSNN